MLHTILDFPYPTVALITGHTFGGGCPFALSHDYRVMNSKRGFISMVSFRLFFSMTGWCFEWVAGMMLTLLGFG